MNLIFILIFITLKKIIIINNLKNLIYNILSLGILHLISLYYPNLYIKLYCNPWPAKECDYFLVENIYGQYTLCLKIHKKNTHNHLNNSNNKDNYISQSNNINIKPEYNIIKNLTYSFIYKSMIYEYNEETNEIIPVHMDLSKMTNKKIIDYFSEGLSTENIVKKYRERYGKNEYNIDIKLPLLFFYKNDIPSFIIVLLIGIIEYIAFRDFVSLIIKSFVILVIFILQFLNLKKIIINKYEKEYTLDGEKNKIKVKRKYLLREYNNFYFEINNSELLPGDIIYLKKNDFVPCDCIIIEGECIVSESNLTGNLDIFKKTSLENNNEQFNYIYNNINILFHGMKIIKVFSKSNDEFISAICINTGANTYKANQYSNILYFSEKNKKYDQYNLFGKGKKIILIDIILAFVISILLALYYIFKYSLNLDKTNLKLFIIKILVRIFCKSIMAVYYITHKIITILTLYKLQNENIICFDSSRLQNSGNINIIIFNKTEILSQEFLEINSYHPICFNSHCRPSLGFRNYLRKECKEMSINLFKYYREYLKKKQNNEIDKSNEYMTLFLECLLSCNNIEKYNLEFFGNNIETAIINDINWDIKIYDFKYNDNEYINEQYYINNYYHNINKNNNNNKSSHDNNKYLTERRICDIFPKNYYKITESLKNENKMYDKRKTSVKNIKNISPIINSIIESLPNFNTYKLRIIKKFIKNGTLSSSAIVYNFLTKELRFMVKGCPEYILNKCNNNSLPEKIEYVISSYRRKGLIIIVCATKLINIEEYNDLNEFDYYMNDLIFCGFITLNNKFEEKTKNSIKQLKEFNCDFIINSGDNEYNCLSAGFNNDIIETNKNVFVFDKEKKVNKITIRKIYSIKNYKEENDDYKKNDINTKLTSKMIGKIISLPNTSPKDNSDLDLIHSSETKKSFNKNKDCSKKSKEIEENKEWKISEITLNVENKKIYHNKNRINDKIINNNKNVKLKNNIFKIKDINNYDNFALYDNEKKNTDNLLSSIDKINKYDKKLLKIDGLNPSKIKNVKDENKQDGNSARKSKNSIFKNRVGTENSIEHFEKFYYYPGIFKDYIELKDNCIYCISGKAFNFLYKNNKNKECKYLLKKIYKKCKIFYNMSSIEKSLLIDFYRKHEKNNICCIGECQCDVDSIISSNVGINLKNPNNQNTILCHFYSSNHDILCVKKIIIEGKVFYENNILLEKFSFICTLAINCYIFCCFINNIEPLEKQLNFLEIIFLIMSVISFTGKAKNNIVMEPLTKNFKLLNIYYILQQIGSLIIKLLSLISFLSLYEIDRQMEKEERGRVFTSYYFILSLEFIICIIYSFKLVSFHTTSPFSNFFLVFFTLILVLYMLILMHLTSSNFKCDFLDLTYFEFSFYLIDSYGDRNKRLLFLSCIFDFLFSLLYSTIIYFIFDKVARYKLSNNKNNVKTKKNKR